MTYIDPVKSARRTRPHLWECSCCVYYEGEGACRCQQIHDQLERAELVEIVPVVGKRYRAAVFFYKEG